MITTTHIRNLIAKAEPDTDAGFQAHRQLQDIDYDLSCADARARQGLGLSEYPERIEPKAAELLYDYLSTH